MKEFTDNELFELAHSQIKIGDKHFFLQTIITILILTQSTFFILNIISIYFFGPIWLVCIVLYLFHRKKIKKSEIKVQEILDELKSRNL